MNYVFNNSSIVSVNSGTIVLNVSGKTRTFVDAKLVSAIDGKIVLDLPFFKLTKDAYVTIHLRFDSGTQRTFISNTDNKSDVTYHVTQFGGGIKSTGSWPGGCILRNATPEEIQELNDQLKAEGKCWNPDTMQIEKLRWKPIKDTKYFHIIIAGGTAQVDDYLWKNDEVDRNYYELGNCFKTKKEAEAKLEEIKKILNPTI